MERRSCHLLHDNNAANRGFFIRAYSKCFSHRLAVLVVALVLLASALLVSRGSPFVSVYRVRGLVTRADLNRQGPRADPGTLATLQPHLDLMSSCLSSPATNCSTAQILGLKRALTYASEQASATWRTWSPTSAQRPEYGFWRFVEPARFPTAGRTSRPKWVVVTSITHPTEQVKQWAALGEWQVLVVGDQKTPSDWTWPNVTFLSVEQQQQLPLRTAQLLPYRNYARKMIGYLYAMANGAELIYETDDDNGPKPGAGLSWILPEQAQGVTVTAKWAGPQNLYAYFGECRIWPRGFPLDALLQTGLDTCQQMNGSVEPSQAPARVFVPVQQGLADLDPDVDAIWRLTNRDRVGNVRFNNAPPLAYRQGTVSPYNTQNTAHHRSAFWAMYIPAGVNMRVCDIWRGYWAQRLLWEIDGSVLFTGGTVDQVRNPHVYELDFRDELQMYIQSSSLIEYLLAWTCPFTNMYDCMLELTVDMAEQGYWPATEVELMTAWIHDLAAIGYQPPNLATHTLQQSGGVTSRINGIPVEQQGTGLSVYLGSLDLFLPVTSRFEAEFRQQLLQSLELFYPLQQAHLTLVMDTEQPADHDLAARLGSELAAKGIVHNFKFAQADPVIYHSRGHDRQQLIMFWADNFTSAEYVGFIDTDTVFVTQVVGRDLFDAAGRPIVIGLVGKPQNEWWSGPPAQTRFLLKQDEVMRCMAYFPFIIRTSHLRELRLHVEKLHNNTFDQLFQEFNIMCNYLWYFHRKEYKFHLQSLDPIWTGSVTGQAPLADLKRILANDSLSHPAARVTVHWGYMQFQPDTKHLADILLQGVCLSASKDLSSVLCRGYSRQHIQEALFVFETNSWLWDKRVVAAQKDHYANVDAVYGGFKPWNITTIQMLRGIVDHSKRSGRKQLNV